MGPPPGGPEPRPATVPWVSPHRFRGLRRRPQKSSTGYPVLDFSARRRGPRNHGNAPIPWASPQRFRDSRRRTQKSSTGYPVLDFWGRRRWPRNHGNATSPWARSHRFRGLRRRTQKSSTGYPVLDFCNRRRGLETAGALWFLGQARTGFEASGGGPKSQAPDIRCLTFGPAAGALKPWRNWWENFGGRFSVGPKT